MFIFGKKNFRIKSCTPFELGVSKNPNQGFNIEIRQNYFHILGIPFFDVGITWHIRKGPTLTPMPLPYRQQIDASKYRVSTPWRTFTGPILIMLCSVAYNVSDVLERRRNDERAMQKERKTMELIPETELDISQNNGYELDKIAVDSLRN